MSTVRNIYRGLHLIAPPRVATFFRGVATAFIAPNTHAFVSGHWRSSLGRRSVDRRGNPIPWYTYPAVEYLHRQSFAGRRILEFGGGQSTFWWAARAESVVTIETDETWAKWLTTVVPKNVDVIYRDLAASGRTEFVVALTNLLRKDYPEPFDVVIVDGGQYRSSYANAAPEFVSAAGAIICDNSEGFGIFESLRDSGFSRVDFYGVAPGTSQRGATSIYFKTGSFLFDNSRPI